MLTFDGIIALTCKFLTFSVLNVTMVQFHVHSTKVNDYIIYNYEQII